MNASEWKIFYAHERVQLGRAGLRRLVERAAQTQAIEFLAGALVFPHTKLTDSGELIADAATAVIRSGLPRVLALGVLHGGLAADAEELRRARNGDEKALERLRRVHGPGAPGDSGCWREEFSLDAFIELLHVAADIFGKKPPEVIVRYPFLTGASPDNLPGIEELHGLIYDGCVLVATTDPIHHGAGYGTPPSERRSAGDPATLAFAKSRIEAQFAALAARNYAAFLEVAAADRSDFRDNGPVLRELLGAAPPHFVIHELRLVDYAQTLQAENPTWVAAALATFTP